MSLKIVIDSIRTHHPVINLVYLERKQEQKNIRILNEDEISLMVKFPYEGT